MKTVPKTELAFATTVSPKQNSFERLDTHVTEQSAGEFVVFFCLISV